MSAQAAQAHPPAGASDTASGSESEHADPDAGVESDEPGTVMHTPQDQGELQYEGQRNVQNARHGTGVCTWATGPVATYDGQWRYDMMHGQGTMTFRNGDVYEGGFRYDLKHGQCRFTKHSGSVFEGQYKDDAKHRGKKTYPCGKSYDGYWLWNMKHGHGEAQSATGDIYRGQFIRGRRHGNGHIEFASGKVFTGFFKNGGIRQGTMTYNEDSSKYTGAFKGGKRSGQGSMKYADGTVYYGAWKRDKRHGHGVLTRGKDTVYAGLWIGGKKDERMQTSLSMSHLDAHLTILLKGEHATCVDISPTDKQVLVHAMCDHQVSYEQLHEIHENALRIWDKEVDTFDHYGLGRNLQQMYNLLPEAQRTLPLKLCFGHYARGLQEYIRNKHEIHHEISVNEFLKSLRKIQKAEQQQASSSSSSSSSSSASSSSSSSASRTRNGDAAAPASKRRRT
jgi:hypothetical protein